MIFVLAACHRAAHLLSATLAASGDCGCFRSRAWSNREQMSPIVQHCARSADAPATRIVDRHHR